MDVCWIVNKYNIYKEVVVMAYMHKTIVCPFCEKPHAHITYEENRVYNIQN